MQYSQHIEKIAHMVKNAVDEIAVNEIILYIENDKQLYKQQHRPIKINLIKKIMQGQYDSNKVIKLFGHLIDNGHKKYNKEITDLSLGRPEKQEAAKRFRDDFEAELKTDDLNKLIEESAVKDIKKNKDALKELIRETKKMSKKDIQKEIIEKYKKTKKGDIKMASSDEILKIAGQVKDSVTDKLKDEAKGKFEKILSVMFLKTTGKYLERSEIDKIKKEYKDVDGNEDKIDYDLLRKTIDKVIKAPGEKE